MICELLHVGILHLESNLEFIYPTFFKDRKGVFAVSCDPCNQLEVKKKRWRLSRNLKIRDSAAALDFVDDLGFVAVVSDRVLPSFYDAVYQSDEVYLHRYNSERVERMWELTHSLASEKRVYYGKLLAKKNLLISMKLFPDILRLYPIPDYNELYWEGNLRKVGKDVINLLSSEGPRSTPEIQTLLGLHQKDEKRELQSVLVELQSQALICCTGTEMRGSAKWGSTVWDTMERWVPEEFRVRASHLSEMEARVHLVERFIYAAIQTSSATIRKYLGWPKKQVAETVDYLADSGIVEEKAGIVTHIST